MTEPLPTPEELDDIVTGLTGDLIDVRHRLHSHPELSNRERDTALFIEDRLRRSGITEIRTGIAGHGVIGVLRGGLGGDRVIALRADMDALPVPERAPVDFASTVVDETYPGGPFPVSHACGHDCHMATVLTAAAALSRVRERLPGTVMFVFQPAEEGAPIGETGGAQAMLDAGAFTDPVPTMVFGMHVAPFPKGTVAYRSGTQMASSVLVRIKVSGAQVHGSTPWLGTDPLPAVADIISASAQLYRRVPAYNPITVSFGHIEDVGRFNIIGESAVLWGTIRAMSDDDMVTTQEHLRDMAIGIGTAHGCTAEVEYLQPVPSVHNTPSWLRPTLVSIENTIGEGRLAPTPPILGYDDVSVFVNAFGGVYLHYGVQDTVMVDGEMRPVDGGRGLAMNHSPDFYADDHALVDSVRIHVRVAVDHLTGALTEDDDS